MIIAPGELRLYGSDNGNNWSYIQEYIVSNRANTIYGLDTWENGKPMKFIVNEPKYYYLTESI